MKILLLDIETAPNLAYVWGLWQQNVSIDKIVNSGYVLCWSAKWYDEKGVVFDSIPLSGERRMLRHIHRLLDKADVVIHYNGSSFDIPTLNKEFVIKGFKPPAPYKQLDLIHTVRKAFRFPSNKLDYVVQTLGLGAKHRHDGFEMWVKCMAGDAASWRVMEKYNRMDVTVLEKLYDRLKPWITNHPNHGSMDDRSCCPACGSERVHREGTRVAVAQVMRYVRYRCGDCGHWFRGTKSIKAERPERYVSIPA